MQALYLRKNNSTDKTLYPFCEFDMEAAISASWGTSIAITPPSSYTGSDLTCYNIYQDGSLNPPALPTIAACFDDDLITDARSNNQPYYFNADTYRDCFGEAETLTAVPADWTATNNSMYYQEIYLGAGSCFMDQPYTFVPGATYQKNETLSGVYETDEGMSFGVSIGYVYRNGLYWYDAVYAHKLMLDGYANLAEYWQYYAPQMTGYPSTRILSGYGPSVEFDMGTMGLVPGTPDTPTNAGSMLVHGTYLGVDYYGCCMYRWDEDTGKCIAFRVFMLPAWCWGDPQEWVPPGPEPEPVIPDPQDYGPESWSEGGGGTLSDTNDVPTIPTAQNLLGGVLGQAYGMHLYRVGTAQYDALMSALYGSGQSWSDLWQRWQNYKYSPIGGIVSSHYIPYPLCGAPPTLVTANIRLAGIAVPDTTSLVMDNAQVYTYTIGQLSIPEYYGSALDYSPYTQMRLYLPFCGWIDINPDYVVGGSLSVTYRTDCATGDICAYVQCTDRTGDTVYMYTATGNCAVSMPVSGNDQGTGSVLGGLMSTATGVLTGNIIGAASGAVSAAAAKHTQQVSGSYSGSISLVCDRQCRLQIIRPVPSIPAHGAELRGYPSDIGLYIRQLVGTGWSSFDVVHPDIEGATAAEAEEIVRLLAEGIIL